MGKEFQSYGAARGDLYAFIVRYCSEHGGNFPTVRSIMDGLGYASSSSAYYHLLRLKGEGKLHKVGGHWTVTGARWLAPGEPLPHMEAPCPATVP